MQYRPVNRISRTVKSTNHALFSQSDSHATGTFHLLEGTFLLEWGGDDVGALWIKLDESRVAETGPGSDVAR